MQLSSTPRLRAEIDQGKARDKVDYPDHAAAPLGTDDEAAGETPQGVASPASGSPSSAPSSLPPDPSQVGEEDHRYPTKRLPTGNTWKLVFGGMALLAVAVATATWIAV
ncbi:MAG: hypothetical protein B7Z15_07650 [Rhizobiales bacterium 32-66-8]|nr:MAG: hypothetical protein B7Z15_07650 [Rhizobiales bacterium 32-66-8]